jgi:hypothetical protein
MKWHRIEEPNDGEGMCTDVAKAADGVFVRTHSWYEPGDSAMCVALVFVPGAQLRDFGLDVDGTALPKEKP